MLSEGNVRSLNMMMTINSLCLFSITEFMDDMLRIKQKYGRNHCFMSFNILRFPSFMSVVTLPEAIRHERAEHLKEWLQVNWHSKDVSDRGRGLLHQMEYEGIERLIAYLREVQTGHSYTSSIESRERDFKSFFTQYDERRGKDFRSTFPELVEWYDSIPVTKLIPIKLVSGDGSHEMPHQKELKERAEKEGWVLEKSNVNPGAQGYVPPKELT
jgi:hypothetical protein